VLHWTVVHPKIKVEVSSYYLAQERVLIDPLVPAAGLDAFERAPEHIYLTNRHHDRDSKKFVERFGCDVWCVRQGVHEFDPGRSIRAFDFGDVLPGEIESIEIGAICPDETALAIPRAEGVLALADGVIRMGDGPLAFVPDAYMGDDPEAVKKGLREAYRRVLDRDFDHLLLAHGLPWIGGAKEALRGFVSEGA
jgi:hypothetical protein